MDIVLYDARFPLMEIAKGVGMYLMEGVIATIEVKTELFSRDVKMAIENCMSIHALNLISPAADSIRQRAAAIRSEFGKTPTEACVQAGCELFPATYVFAFRGLEPGSLCDAIDKCFGNGFPVVEFDAQAPDGPTGACPALPRVIIAGNSIGAANDGWITFHHTDEDKAAILANHGTNGRAMMAFWKTQWPFWWFGTHILHTVGCRLGMRHAASGLTYGVEPYIGSPDELEKPVLMFTSVIRGPQVG
jgi:hypothetical protein